MIQTTEIILVIITAVLAAAGSSIASALLVGPRVAREQAKEIGILSTHLATLDVRMMNGMTTTLNKHTEDIRELVLGIRELPCERHTGLLSRLEEMMGHMERRMERIESKLEVGK